MSKYSQYSYESPVTSLPISCIYFNLLIFCQSSVSNTVMNKATQTFNTFLSIYVFSPSISGKPRHSFLCLPVAQTANSPALFPVISLFLSVTEKKVSPKLSKTDSFMCDLDPCIPHLL